MKTHGWVLTFYIMQFYQAAAKCQGLITRPLNEELLWIALWLHLHCVLSDVWEILQLSFSLQLRMWPKPFLTLLVSDWMCASLCLPLWITDSFFSKWQIAKHLRRGFVRLKWNDIIGSPACSGAFRQNDCCSSISVEVNLIALVLRDIQQWIILLRCVSVAAQSHRRKSCLQFCYLNCKG